MKAYFTPKGLGILRNMAKNGNPKGYIPIFFVIINQSSYALRRTKHRCQIGNFTEGMHPEKDIPPHTSTVYGVEEHMSQEVICSVTYSLQGSDSDKREDIVLYIQHIGQNSLEPEVGNHMKNLVTTKISSGYGPGPDISRNFYYQVILKNV